MSDTLATLHEALSDRYRIERELGRGGMATVYLAHDLKHDRDVALKVLRLELAAVLGRERFLAEIRLTAKLDHPHILTLIDSGESGGHLWYVVPFVRGESLRQRLERERQLEIEEAVRITMQVAAALDYAHRHGVIHRDLKPENILLHEGEAMLADFGIALAVTEAAGSRLTESGLSLGTPQYMSPEQATGDRQLDARSDVYSLGAVLYEMLAGEPPHSGPSVQAVIAKLLTTEPIRLHLLRTTVPGAVDEAVQRALARLPADRFQSAGAFAAALSTSPGTTLPGRAQGRTLPASRRSLSLVAAVALLLVAVAVYYALSRGRNQRASTGPDPRRIAVLYFDVRGGGDSLRYLAEGLTEALIRELAQVKELDVISRGGVAPYRGGTVGPDSIARALAVGTIVSGTVEPAGDSVRLTVEMVNPVTGKLVGSKVAAAPRRDLLSLGDAMARDFSLLLRQRLGQAVRELSRDAETRNPQAWDLMQRGRGARRVADSLIAAGDSGAAGRMLDLADSTLRAAGDLDRRWAAPVVERGWVAADRRRFGALDRKHVTAWSAQALPLAAEGLRRKPGDPGALHLRGMVRYFQWLMNLEVPPFTADQLLGAAEQDLRGGAAEENPDRAAALVLLSHLLFRKSQMAEGMLAAQQAYQADPYVTEASVILWQLFAGALDLGQAGDARRWCVEGFRRFPEDPFFTDCRIMQEALPGSRPDPARLWRLAAENETRWPVAARAFRRSRGELLVAMGLVRAGLPESARAVARRVRADSMMEANGELLYVEALLQNLIGDRTAALGLLDQYLRLNPQDRATLAADQTWWLDGLRDDPRFRQLTGAPATPGR